MSFEYFDFMLLAILFVMKSWR